MTDPASNFVREIIKLVYQTSKYLMPCIGQVHPVMFRRHLTTTIARSTVRDPTATADSIRANAKVCSSFSL
jgi:hypothetical protein